MEKYQTGVILTLLLVSVAVLLIPGFLCGIRRLLKKSQPGMVQHSTVSRILLISAAMILSVWCLRYAVGYYAIVSANNSVSVLTPWEEIFNSMIHTLQTFSMDEDYTAYIMDGKGMLGEILGAESRWIGVYGLYASILNLAAPIAGGAIIFEILASIFPKIRLRMTYLAVWKEKYFFSELNEASLALAKSICAVPVSAVKRPVIVFTDAYVDDENENSTEMLLEAKQIGAICIEEDLAHVSKNRAGMRKFFLIDRVDAGNLKCLVELASPANRRYLKKAEIYLFTNDDAYLQVERSVRDQLISESGFTEEELPVLVPVLCYRNLISSLLQEIPLYEPLIGKSREPDGSQTLQVTILGTGHIGTEMFLTTYWMGQILNCNLKIRIFSQEEENAFWSKVDYVNPEIRHTTIENDPILRINRKWEMAKVYCQVEYTQSDVKSSEFLLKLAEENGRVLDTDYFFVALGSDEENLSVANTIRKYVGQHHIKVNKSIKTVIAYIIYDSALSASLNRKKYYKFVGDTADVYMQAIGCLEDVYSVRNVFMADHEPHAQKADDAYASLQSREERAKAHKNRLKDDYKHWASRARVMHLSYKAYSMGLTASSLFDFPESEEAYREARRRVLDTYRSIISGEVEFATEQEEAAHLNLLHRMAWLEHRRWNAFTRVMGYRGTGDYGTYGIPGVSGSYKQMDLKLHPCLVECDQKGIRAEISTKGIVDQSTMFRCEETDDFDLLDDLSYDLYQRELNSYDFKLYDYPISGI